MSYDGVEIDMLSLGDADSILVTRWTNNLPTRVLIDGGDISDGEKVVDFLRKRNVRYLDHIVCSHPHDDHAAGLVDVVDCEEIDFGQAWLHQPQNHASFSGLREAMSKTTANKVKRILEESLSSELLLRISLELRQKPFREPFKGMQIGFLTVLGPSLEFYEEQLAQFSDLGKLDELEEALSSYQQRIDREENPFLSSSLGLGSSLFGSSLLGSTGSATESIGLGEAPTEPENETSTVLGFVHGADTFLLTADAGVEALTRVSGGYRLGGLRWMQIPHHGSRRNVNESLINYFKPETAYVSAEGTNKHPRRAVVNAFNRAGTEVFSTHYPNGGHLWFRVGNVPVRPEYGNAVALYNAS
ncbi:MAG: hypothetical protein JOZ61_10990 [Verrucomicrobia bacterium]|nr:hypothetical protein [Verrucomicrobiota bacterium]